MQLTFANQGHNYNQTARALINIVEMLVNVARSNGVYKFKRCSGQKWLFCSLLWLLPVGIPLVLGMPYGYSIQMAFNPHKLALQFLGYNLKGSWSRYLYTFVQSLETVKKKSKMLGHDGHIIGSRVYGICNTVGDYIIPCAHTNEQAGPDYASIILE